MLACLEKTYKPCTCANVNISVLVNGFPYTGVESKPGINLSALKARNRMKPFSDKSTGKERWRVMILKTLLNPVVYQLRTDTQVNHLLLLQFKLKQTYSSLVFWLTDTSASL